MLYEDLKVYLVIKNELKKNPSTQYRSSEWYHYGLTCHRLQRSEDCKFAFMKIHSRSPTSIIKLVDMLILDYKVNLFKVERPDDQIASLYSLYSKFMTGIQQDSFEVYFDVYGCNTFRDPFYHYIIELCKIHGLELVQLWIFHAAMTKEERRLMENLIKYASTLQIE